MLKALRRRDAALVDASGFGGFNAVRGIRQPRPHLSVIGSGNTGPFSGGQMPPPVAALGRHRLALAEPMQQGSVT
jgi:hypothetical protein